MRLLYFKAKDLKHGRWCAYISTKFQGIGCIFSANEAITLKEYYLFKVMLLYFVFWIAIDK